MATTYSSQPQRFNVIVTGFGYNPSGDIAKSMPSKIAADDALNISGVDLNLVRVPQQFFPEFSWAKVRQDINDLHENHGDDIDLWIHLGRSQWNHVTCERRAYRQDFTSNWLAEYGDKGYYRFVDNYGKILDDVGPCPWMDLPSGLRTALDVDQVVVDANKQLIAHGKAQQKSCLEVKSHCEPASHLCGFTHYESMAHRYKRGKSLDVLFCHVPPHENQAAMDQAKEAILAIIGASYVSIQNSKNRDPKLPDEWKGRFEADP